MFTNDWTYLSSGNSNTKCLNAAAEQRKQKEQLPTDSDFHFQGNSTKILV